MRVAQIVNSCHLLPRSFGVQSVCRASRSGTVGLEVAVRSGCTLSCEDTCDFVSVVLTLRSGVIVRYLKSLGSGLWGRWEQFAACRASSDTWVACCWYIWAVSLSLSSRVSRKAAEAASIKSSTHTTRDCSKNLCLDSCHESAAWQPGLPGCTKRATSTDLVRQFLTALR